MRRFALMALALAFALVSACTDAKNFSREAQKTTKDLDSESESSDFVTEETSTVKGARDDEDDARTGKKASSKSKSKNDDVDDEETGEVSTAPSDKPQSDAALRSCPSADGVTMADVDQWVAKHAAANPNYKYAYLPLDLAGNDEDANLARVGLFKALNHTAIDAKSIYVGEDVSDGKGIVYAIDPEKLWPGYGASAWNTIAAARGSNTGTPGASPQAEKPFDPNRPVSMDQVAYNALVPSVYLTLIKAPAVESGVRSRLNTGDTVAWSAIKDAIVFGPRIIFVRKAADGRNYWVSCDEFIGQEGKEINASPDNVPTANGVKCNGSGSLSVATIQAHEAWHDMENGFPAYYVFGAVSQTRGKAERLFVVDPGNPVRAATTQGMNGGELLTGRSCVTCHIAGVQQLPSDYSGRGNWTSNTELTRLYDESRVRFQGAMRAVVEGVSCNAPKEWRETTIRGGSKKEPANHLIERIER